MTPFGPQLLGETEKALGGVLARVLDNTGLTERQWVALRLAGQNDGRTELVGLISDRAHFADAERIVTSLTDRGLIIGNRLSPAGQTLLEELQASVDSVAAPIWRDLPPSDVAAAERLLNTVAGRARSVLAEWES
ncbi:MAG TPA: hypothetical protein VIP82_03800 [Microbacterium sp.]|jgi:hypothetical protein|uniref:hypothetical protein n=1 Tax=Microbacterium sp. TaxID=51671 RepID=UPI002F938792